MYDGMAATPRRVIQRLAQSRPSCPLLAGDEVIEVRCGTPERFCPFGDYRAAVGAACQWRQPAAVSMADELHHFQR